MAFGDNIQNRPRITHATAAVLAFSSNVTAGNLLLAFTTVDSTSATVTVTDSQSNTYSVLGTADQSPQHVQIFWAIAGSSAACTVTCTRSVAGSTIWASVSEFEGPFAPSPVGDSSTSTGTGTATTTGTITPARAGSLLIGYISADGALTQTSDWTEIENTVELVTLSMVNAYKLKADTSTDAFTADQNVSQAWGGVGGSFNPLQIVFAASPGSYAVTGFAVTLFRSSRVGHIYRVDTGTTFDNESITSYVTLPWQQAPNPQTHDKVVQWLDLTAYLKGTATVNVDARFADEPHEFAAATFTTYGTIGATPDGDKGFVYLGVTSRWMQVRLRATSLSFEIQPPLVIGYNPTGRRI